MTDVATLINRAYVTYLEPPDQQPALCRVTEAVDADDVGPVTFTNFEVPEDEELLRVGAIIELGSELMRVEAYDDLAMTATLTRGYLGTPAVAHAANSLAKINPSYPRYSVFSAVADNIVGLYPELYTVNTEFLASVAGSVVPLNDDLGVEVVDIWQGSSASQMAGRPISGRIVDFHPAAGGRAVLLDTIAGGVWVRYRRRFGDAPDEETTWEELGLEPRWAHIVVIGACADLFSGRDLPASHVEWASNVLAAENIRVGTRSSLAAGLTQYRGMLIDRAKSEMRAEYKAKVRVRQVSAW